MFYEYGVLLMHFWYLEAKSRYWLGSNDIFLEIVCT